MSDNLPISERYREICATFRFFLTWRHALLAGVFAALYGTVTLTIGVLSRSPQIAGAIPVASAIVVLALWLFDVRLRELYHGAMKAGKQIEGESGGLFTEISYSDNGWLTHSNAINALCFIAIVGLVGFGFWLTSTGGLSLMG
jgi:hypothetical protein